MNPLDKLFEDLEAVFGPGSVHSEEDLEEMSSFRPVEAIAIYDHPITEEYVVAFRHGATLLDIVKPFGPVDSLPIANWFFHADSAEQNSMVLRTKAISPGGTAFVMSNKTFLQEQAKIVDANRGVPIVVTDLNEREADGED